MEDEQQRIVLAVVFGESSNSEDEEDGDNSHIWPIHPGSNSIPHADRVHYDLGRNPRCERVRETNGLWICRDFLSDDQQSSLLSAIENEGWFSEACHNQAMRFGDLPAWATELSNSIRLLVHGDKDDDFFPSELLWRDPLFDQLIVNRYQPGEGICAHVDLLRFEDGIAVVSLESSCVMDFSKVDEGNRCEPNRFPVFLAPGSLILMSGEARYQWKHEINRSPGFQIWAGQEIDQQRRTSITLRRLC